MGRPKLLLPVGGSTVIARVLGVLRRPEIVATVVVSRPADRELQQAVSLAGGVNVVPPSDPLDMRASVERALDWLEGQTEFAAIDGWLLVPADHPLLDRRLLDALLARWAEGNCRILIPTHEGRRGHPVIFHRDFIDAVRRIPPAEGLNWLVREHAAEVTELPWDNPAVLADLDTPEDYARLLRETD